MTGLVVRLLKYPRQELLTILSVAMLTLLGVGAALLVPWPLKLIIDNVLQGQPLPPQVSWIIALPWTGSETGLLGWLVSATVLLFILRRIISIIRKYVQAGFANRMVYALASDLFESLQRQSVLFYGKRQTGDLVRRVTADTKCVNQLVVDVLLPGVTSLATLLGMFVIIWQMNNELALFATGLSLPLTFIVARFVEPISAMKYEEQRLQGRMLAQAEQTLSALPVVQAFGQEDRETKIFRDLTDATLRANMSAEIIQQKFRVSAGSVSAAAAALAMLVGGISVLEGDLTVGSLLVLMSYFSSLYTPMETLAYLSSSYAAAKAGARRIFEVFDQTETQIPDAPAAKPLFLRNSNGVAISFRNVTFGYEAEKPVLRDINIDIQPGETTAIIGPTGAGKSTLAALVPRLMDPWSGTVTLDGQNIRNISLASLRSNISVVMQEPFLLPLSIWDNIAFGLDNATEREVRDAAVLANADEFIRELPGTYDAVIGELGVTLSGGQRQRLSLARAILKKAPVLILDEPTSALDNKTEQAVISAIGILSKLSTVMLIAHRMSTLRIADTILALENGEVVERGRAADLLHGQGMFNFYSNLQSGIER